MSTTVKLSKDKKTMTVITEMPFNPRHVTNNGKANKNITLGHHPFKEGSYELAGVGNVSVQVTATVDPFSAQANNLEYESIVKTPVGPA